MASPRLFVVGDIGGASDYHLGDEAMLEANLHMFRQLVPGIEFTVPSRDPAWTRRRYGVDSLPAPRFGPGTLEEPDLRREPEVAAALRECDGLVVSGGGNMSSTWPEKIAERVALIEEARQAGLPVVVVGQTIGPALTDDQRRLLGQALPYASWVGVREEPSATLARHLGVPADSLHRQLDDAFFSEPQVVIDERADTLRDAAKPWILVTIDASYAAPEKEKSLRVLASQLDGIAESLQATLFFVPHVGGADLPDEQCDLTVGRALAALMRTPLVLLDTWQPREARWLAGEAAMVISTRYHPLVFATAAGVPALGIYSDEYTRTKLRGALACADLEDWTLPLADAATGMLLPLAMELWHQRDAVRERMARLHDEAWPKEVLRWEAICAALRLPAGEELARPHAGERLQVIDREKPEELPRHFELDWWHYERNGYMRLGRVLDDEQLAVLRVRLNDIQLGKVLHPTVQIIEGLPRIDLAGRRILGLEADPQVLGILRRDLFREICARQYGRHVSISVLRAMMVSRPVGSDTHFAWQQDGAEEWKLDRDPLVTLWIPLDSSTQPRNSLQVIPGSHRLGLLGRSVSESDAEKYCGEKAVAYLDFEAGEGFLLHGWLLRRIHASVPRQLLSFSYVDARTVNALTGERYPLIFGEPEATNPYLRALAEDNRRLRETAEEAERYARSLIQENAMRERTREEESRSLRETADAAKRYARSLLQESRKRERALTEETRGLRETADKAAEYARALADENRSLREVADAAQQYAQSLLHENEQRERMRAETEQYARSLEGEIGKLQQYLGSLPAENPAPAEPEQDGPKSTQRRSFAGFLRRLIWSRLSRRPE